MLRVCKKAAGVLLTLAIIMGLVLPAGMTVHAATDQTQYGAEGMVNYKHVGGHDYQVEDPEWVNVFCAIPDRSGTDTGVNENYRWKWNLSANPWLFDNSQKKVNGSNKPGSDQLQKLAAILWVAQKNEASVDDTTNAVFWFVTNGADDYTSSTSSYKNDIVTEAGDSGWAVPTNYTLYMYLPDSDTTHILQNMVRLQVWSEEGGDKPEDVPGKNFSSVTVEAKKSLTGEGAPALGTADEKQFAFRLLGTSANAYAENGKPYLHSRYNDGENIYFGEILLADPGTYEYVVYEVDPDGDTHTDIEGNAMADLEGLQNLKSSGVKYDTTEFTLKLTVESDGVNTVIKDESGNDITGQTIEIGTFTNTVEPEPEPEPEPEDREPSIGTTVKAGEVEATTEKEARLTYDQVQEKVAVVDTVAYTDLCVGVKYTVKGTLVEVGEDGKVKNENVATSSDTFVAEEADGEFELDFGDVQLKSYAKYVVYEEVYAKEGDDQATKDEPLEHKDLEDKAQTILTEDEEGYVLGDKKTPVYEGKLATTVSAGGKSATTDKVLSLTSTEAKAITRVTDTIAYSGLQGGDTYEVTGKLMKVAEDGTATQVGNPVTQELVADESGSGMWVMTFSNVKLEAGSKYVVFESAANTDASKAEDVAEHADLEDKAQTIVVASSVTPTKNATSPKTGEPQRTIPVVAVMLVVMIGAALMIRRQKA